MKLVTTFLLSLFIFICQELPNVRQSYVDASKSQKNAEAFMDLVSNYNKENDVLMAYKGAAITLKAKYAKQIKLKKSLFIEGVKVLESALKKQPNNIEIRLIRLSIQENSPKILNYKSAIEEDKKLLLSNFDKQNPSLKEFIKKFIIQSNSFSDKEKERILN